MDATTGGRKGGIERRNNSRSATSSENRDGINACYVGCEHIGDGGGGVMNVIRYIIKATMSTTMLTIRRMGIRGRGHGWVWVWDLGRGVAGQG